MAIIDDQPVDDRFRMALVDDTEDIRNLLRVAFERTKRFRVVAEAGNGQDGVDVTRAHSPDVVLLDISMPVMDGLEALPLVRQVCPSATVVMLSAIGAEEMKDKALELGADGYIQKGLPLAALVAQVEELVHRAPAGPSPASA
jgi:DNA-binding NarL/FixJ family response regulator